MRAAGFRSADSRVNEEAIYQQVADEIASGIRRDGLWAKAIADTGGSMDAAKARYIQLRAQSIKDEMEHSQGPSATLASRAAHSGEEAPAGVKGWSWGAFLLNWIWAIGNKTWWGTLALVPYLGFFVALYLGFKGRELAWKNKQWSSYDEFDATQKRWSFWGVTLVGGIFFIGVAFAVAIPAYQSHKQQSTAAATTTIEAVSEPNPAPDAPTDDEVRQTHLDAIYRAHPDADQVFNSAEFRDWLAKNEVWVETTKSGTTDQVISMFNSFKSEQKAAPSNIAQAHQPAPERAIPFASRDDVKAVMQRARADYPYLATAEGRPVVKMILRMAEDLAQREGYHSVDAVTRAVRELAPSHEVAATYRAPQQQPVVADTDQVDEPPRTDKGGRPCRMVSASPISFQCD